MDDASKTKTREELLIEVDELRRQLAEAQATLKTGRGVKLDQGHGQEARQRSQGELEFRVEARTAALLAANQQLQEELTQHRQAQAEQQRLLAEVQTYSEALRISNEELKIRGEELRVQNETLQGQAAELADLTRELQVSRNLQQAVLEQMPAGVIIAEAPSGRIILTNRRAEAIWGQAPGSLRDLQEFRQIPRSYPDGRARPPEAIPLGRALSLGETVVDEEEFLERRDGHRVQRIHLNVNATPVRDPQGSIIAAVATYTDITACKQAREALGQSEERYRSLVELSPDAIVVHVQGKIVFVNPAAVKLFGAATREDLLGQMELDLIHPDYRDAVQDRIQKIRAGLELNAQEKKILRLDGEVVEVEGIASGIMYHGRPAVQVVLRDITERKQAREALRAANEKLRAMIEASPLAIFHLDVAGIIQGVNPAAERIFGWRTAELLGGPLLMVPEEQWQEVRTLFRRVCQGEQLTGLELRRRRKDGAWIDVSISVAAIYDENGEVTGMVSLAEDITARKEAGAALRRERDFVTALLDTLGALVVVMDREGRIISFNNACEQTTGYSFREVQGKPFFDLFLVPEEIQGVKEVFKELSAGHFPNTHVNHWVTKEGNRRLISWSNSILKDEQGQVAYIIGTGIDVSGRKEAEAALAESEARFRAIFEGAAIGIALTDTAGRILAINPAFEKSLGYCFPDLCDKTFADLTHPEDLQVSLRHFEDMMAGGRDHYHLENRYICKDGKVMWCNLAVSLIRDAAGAPAFAVGMIEDITARKTAEEALGQERQRLFDLLEALPASIYLQGEDFTVRFTNRRCREIFGDAQNQKCYEAFHELPAPCAGCPCPSIIQTQTSQVFDRTTADGRTFQVYKYPFRDIDGSPCVLSLGLDITARKQAEEAVRESEARFRLLAENLDDAIMLASGDWQRVHYISPAYERLWGRSCASLYQEPRSWLESVVPEDRETVKLGLKQRMTGDFSEREFPQFRIRRPDGAIRWIAARFFPIRNEAGEVYRIAGTATDITSRKEVEAVLRWRQEHLGQTAKMEAVGRLAGGVAHDFNNLLTVISGYGELLLADFQEADPQRQQVLAILKAADQATVVTRQLLAFSRKQMLQPQILDLNGLITGLVQMFGRLVDENIQVAMILAPELGLVKADPSHIEQVIMNLAINAMDAMPQGGALTIETANVQVAPKDTRRHPEVAPGAYVVVKVADTGVGMNQEILSHIFEPFFSTKERGKGTGLGLSMAYGIVKQSGGHILVESTPQKGSSFRIYLPRVAKAAKSAELAASALNSLQDTGTILLVEDESGVRHVVQRMLTLRGYSVLTARDGQEALQIGQNHPGPIHLLLTDVAMPVMGGRELAERLASAHPEMKVLFMSGHTEDGMVRRGVRESVINFIQKPFRAEQLLHKIRRLLAHPKP